MKRSILLMIPAILLVVWVVVVAAEIPEEAGLPAGAESRLDQYIAHSLSPGSITAHSVKRARKPWNFNQAVSSRVDGDTVCYQTDSSYSGMPLPFPPKEMWCVLLETDARSGVTPYGGVFVGLHMDMYNSDWVVHEIATDFSTPGFEETLSLIGCDLGLD